MSRSRHVLRCLQWWDWALLFYRDNREMRRRGRVKREKDRARVDARELELTTPAASEKGGE